MAKKLSQEELRQLMNEKLKKNQHQKKIDSPIAKYDDFGKLWCRICNQIINNELLWSTHLIGKLHKKKIEELKLKSKSLTDNNNKLNQNTTLKRSLPVVDDDDNKDNVETNKLRKLSDDTDDTKQDSSTSKSLPKDFLKNENEIEMNSEIATDNESTINDELPKGFFDDPKIEQKIRNKSKNDNKTTKTIENEYELFRKEIAEESLISSQNLIMDEEIEELENEKTLNEIDEQIENWKKVNTIQIKIEEIHHHKKQYENVKNSNVNDNNDDDDDDDDDDDQIDFNDINFWRNKDVFC